MGAKVGPERQHLEPLGGEERAEGRRREVERMELEGDVPVEPAEGAFPGEADHRQLQKVDERMELIGHLQHQQTVRREDVATLRYFSVSRGSRTCSTLWETMTSKRLPRNGDRHQASETLTSIPSA